MSRTLYLSSYLAIMQHAPQITAKWVYSECKNILGANIFQQNFRKLRLNCTFCLVADRLQPPPSILQLIELIEDLLLGQRGYCAKQFNILCNFLIRFRVFSLLLQQPFSCSVPNVMSLSISGEQRRVRPL